MKKAEIRKVYKAKRLALDDSTYETYSLRIAELFFEHIDLSSVRVLHCYLPILHKKEINVLMILERLQRERPEMELQVPIIQGEQIVSAIYQAETKLVANDFGIPQPEQLKLASKIPDLIVTPLLAFDSKGFRVGYGGGYYDKFFSVLPPNVQKIGLSFFPSLEGIDDLDEFDVPLDLCITPSHVYEFEFGY